MNVEIENKATQFQFWEYMFQTLDTVRDLKLRAWLQYS